MKMIEDYLKYYIGQQCKGHKGKGILRGFDSRYFMGDAYVMITTPENQTPDEDYITNDYSCKAADVKPLLRPLSSMTEEEAIEVAKLSEWEPHFTNPRVEKNKFDDLIVRWGAGRDQIESYNATGELFYCYEQFHYLLNKGFDLFQLIEEGLALAANPQSSVTNQTRL